MLDFSLFYAVKPLISIYHYCQKLNWIKTWHHKLWVFMERSVLFGDFPAIVDVSFVQINVKIQDISIINDCLIRTSCSLMSK